MRRAALIFAILLAVSAPLKAQWRSAWEVDSTSNQLSYFGAFESIKPAVGLAQSLTFLRPLGRVRGHLFQIDAVTEVSYINRWQYLTTTSFATGFPQIVSSDTTINIHSLDLSVGVHLNCLRFMPIFAEISVGVSDLTSASFNSNNGSENLPIGSRLKMFLGTGMGVSLSLSRTIFATFRMRETQYFYPSFTYDSHGSSIKLDGVIFGLSLGVIL